MVGAKFSYDIGVTIGATWLGVIMGLNGGVLAGLTTTLLCDRLLRALQRD